MSESFYQRLDRIEQENRIARIFKDRPANLHDYQGCANDLIMAKERDFMESDRQEAKRFADAFIEEVNADHNDVIRMSRDAGCRIRDHIETLRRAANPTPVSPLGRQEEYPSGYDNPLTMDRILQLAHVLCKCPPEYRSSWSCDPCRAFAELIFFRQSAATPVSVGGEDKKKNSNSSVK